MTLIQPNKHSHLLNMSILILSVAVVGAVVGLIFVYNQTVSYTQGAAALQQESTRLQAENSELKSRTFALLAPERLANIAAGQGMRTSNATWVAASHF